MAVREHDRVVLKKDLPASGLVAGDVGTVVHIYRGQKAVEVEFLALNGETIALEPLPASKVRKVARREITHARVVAAG